MIFGPNTKEMDAKMNQTPVFIKANIEMTVDDVQLQFRNKNVSLFGVGSLPWPPLSPKKHFGKVVTAHIRTLTNPAQKVTVEAIILREYTANGDRMGLRFNLDADSKKQLLAVIKDFGFFPTSHFRKYPRVPAAYDIGTFPLRVLIRPHDYSDRPEDTPPVICDLKNLSIGGVLISTDNPFALSLEPMDLMAIYFEPRGDFSMEVELQGVICRVIDQLDPSSRNLTRSFGVKFTKVNEENQMAYLELLKDILTRLKDKKEG